MSFFGRFLQASLLVFSVVSSVLGFGAVARAGDSGLSCDIKPVAAAKIPVESRVLKINENQVLFVQTIAPSKEGMPTLLLMPGVNRNLMLDEPSGQMLATQGFGVATYSFSSQPFSVTSLADGVRPAFRSKDVTLKSLALETEAVAAEILRLGESKSVIPVSLSYSGAVSPYLKGFPLVIETVPMTSSAAVNPDLEKVRRQLIDAEFFNPFFGPTITRNTLDYGYRSTWSKQVDAISKQFKLSDKRRDDMIEGYTSMSRATEGFEWDAQTLSNDARRVFVLAGNDSPALQAHQIATFQQVSEKDPDALLIVVLDAGHVLPVDQPAAYACALQLALNETIGGGVIALDPKSTKVELLTGKKAEAFLKKLASAKN